MEGRDSEFVTTMKEVLGQRPGKAATYTHIECKIGGLERAVMGTSTVADWLKEHPEGCATYIFLNKVDKRTALSNMKLDKGVVTTGEAEQGKLFATTYSHWIRQPKKPGNNEGPLVIVMDMGFGVRTGGMALAATTMLHNIQELLQGDNTGTTVSWISVSYLGEALLSATSGSLVEGLALPDFADPRLCHQDREHEKANGVQIADDDWQSAAAGQILDEVIKDASLPMAIVFVMSIEDAYLISNELATLSGFPPFVLRFIHPWSASQHVREATASSEKLNIVYIDLEVSIVPAIHNLKAIFVAPVLNVDAFDINTTSVVRKKVVCGLTTALATSIGAAGPGKPVVHMVKGFSQLGPAADRHITGLEEQAELSPAADRDFWCLSLAIDAEIGHYAFPGLLSVVVPPLVPKLEEAARRLDLWHLLDRSDLPPGVDPRSSRLRSRLAVPAGKYIKRESNIHSVVLLAHVRRRIPSKVKRVLIDLAVLISYGPSSVFNYLGTAKSEREHRRIIQGLGKSTGFAKEHCHKGLLWQALAYLNHYRNHMTDGSWGAVDSAATGLDGVVRYDLLARLLECISWWRSTFKISEAGGNEMLSTEDFELVEMILVSAFPFNLMMVQAEDVGYFGRDLTSEVILEEEATDGTVNWQPLKKEAKESGPGFVTAIYSHLWMDTAEDDMSVYRAVGVTAISASAVRAGLRYLGIDHFASLRPVIRPERRCLIPRGESWSSRRVDSSEDSSSSGDTSA